MERKEGFTLVELLVVIAIIAILASLIVPAISSARNTARRNSVKVLLKDLDTSLASYHRDYNRYPPDNIANGGAADTGTYVYRNDVLIPFLDGDPTTGAGTSTTVYYDFDPANIQNTTVLIDTFEEPVWYHNFLEDVDKTDPSTYSKITGPASQPYHPNVSRLRPRSYQTYSKADFPDDPYGSLTPTRDTLRWIINYDQ